MLFPVKPSLSFILPNYNHSHCILDSLNAILSQSRKAEEVIVVDDGSTDSSVEVIEKVAKDHPEVRLFRHEKNQGTIAALNTGLKVSRGTHVAFGSSDDIVLPMFFEIAMSQIEQYPHTGFFCSRICFFHDDAPEIYEEEKDWLQLQTSKLFSPKEALQLFRQTNFRISTSSAIFKKSSSLAMGGYRNEAAMLSDWLLNCQIALQDGFVYYPQVFAAVRKTKTPSYSAKIYSDRKKREAVYLTIISFIKKNDPQKIYRKSLIVYQLGMDFLIYLFKHPIYWNFIPAIFMKKFKLTIKKAVVFK